MTMKLKLFDSELKIMEALWQEGSMTAKQLVEKMKETTGWNKNTTYTVIKKCIAKGAVGRTEPNFLCTSLISKAEVQAYEADELVNKMFDGSAFSLFATLVDQKGLTPEEVERLKQLVEQLK